MEHLKCWRRVLRSPEGKWTRRSLALPDNMYTDVASTDLESDRAFINVAGFLSPSSVWLAYAKKGTAVSISYSEYVGKLWLERGGSASRAGRTADC